MDYLQVWDMKLSAVQWKEIIKINSYLYMYSAHTVYNNELLPDYSILFYPKYCSH